MNEAALWEFTRSQSQGGPPATPPSVDEQIDQSLRATEQGMEDIKFRRGETNPDQTMLNDLTASIIAEEALRHSGFGNNLIRNMGDNGLRALTQNADNALKRNPMTYLKGGLMDAIKMPFQNGRFVTGLAGGGARLIPPLAAASTLHMVAPYVRSGLYDEIDHNALTGALRGSHPSYFNDETLMHMARNGVAEAEEILMHRTSVDGKPRPIEPLPPAPEDATSWHRNAYEQGLITLDELEARTQEERERREEKFLPIKYTPIPEDPEMYKIWHAKKYGREIEVDESWLNDDLNQTMP